MNKASGPDSCPYKVLLWAAIFAAFLVVHTPKDKIVIISEYAIDFIFDKVEFAKGVFGDKASANWTVQSLAFRMKRIVFLISLIILCCPILRSLKRAKFLWDPQKLKKRLLISGIIFLLLSVFVFPVRLDGYGTHYARMSISPFEIKTGWIHRRLLMPAIAHYLGFQGQMLYYIFSMIINFVLVFFVTAYFEFEKVKINTLHLISIASSSFLIFNFMLPGFADSLMFILFLIALTAADNHESRLAITALTLAAHEGSVFILAPMILFFFPRKDMYKYFLVIAMYFGLYMLSYKLNAVELVESHTLIDNKIGIGWAWEYPLRALGGWFFAYKMLWLIIVYAVFEMLRARNIALALSVICIGIIAPMVVNVLTVDVSRHVAEGFLGLLISYSYLVKSGRGNRNFLNAVLTLNILIPSIYVGTNIGFRSAPGLYEWLYKLSGLHKLLGSI